MELLRAVKRKIKGEKWARNSFEQSIIEHEIGLVVTLALGALVIVGIVVTQ